MIGYCPLASGSKGNCLYLGTSKVKILVDAGLSAKATRERLSEIGVDINSIDAIVITHDHGDHILGLKALSNKYGIPVYANNETAKGIVEYSQECPKFKIFSTGESFTIGDIQVHPFSIQHDTLDPVAFTFQFDELKVGVCTDLGFATSLVKTHLRNCDYLVVEANHQPSMVYASARPMVYKQRVLSRSGHLSNESCGELLAEVAHAGLKHVHLAHLSSECNTPLVALQVIKEILNKHGIDLSMTVAPQEKISQAITF